MKKLLLIAALISNYCSAQISLDQTYTPSNISAIVLSTSGDKIAVKDTGANQIKIYNPDYSLWKTINAPSVSGYKFSGFAYISDNLFNSDGNLEAIAIYNNFSATPAQYYKAQIIDESGSVIYDLGFAGGFGVHYINGVYKLFTNNFYDFSNKIYSLPGTIPCGKCGSLGLAKPAAGGDETLLSIPNPNNGMFKVDGTGELFITDVAGKRIYQAADYNGAVIDISKYPAGIYQVNLNGVQGTCIKQ